jgi:hypothetical protein
VKGKYADQQQWAALAMMSSAPEVRGYIEIQLAYSTALVHAFCGRPEHAIRVTVDLEAEFAGSLPPWMLQAWTLWKADVLQLSGHHADALAVAYSSLESHGFQLRSSSFAGPFARWIALTSHVGDGRARAQDLVRELTDNLETYDTLDQLEILFANIYLGLTLDQVGEALPVMKRLERLPPITRKQLACYGILQEPV